MSDQTDLIQGTLDLLILRTIALEPMHGWAIAQRIQQISDELLRVQQGSLYPALHRLEHQGWITAEWGASETNRRARFYSLTKAGRKQLDTELSKWERLSAGVNLVLAEDVDHAALAHPPHPAASLAASAAGAKRSCSEELQLHLERETERLQAERPVARRGAAAGPARVRRRRAIKEECRDARGTAACDALVARHAPRAPAPGPRLALHGGRRPDPRPRHRRQHRHLQPRQRHALPPAGRLPIPIGSSTSIRTAPTAAAGRDLVPGLPGHGGVHRRLRGTTAASVPIGVNYLDDGALRAGGRRAHDARRIWPCWDSGRRSGAGSTRPRTRRARRWSPSLGHEAWTKKFRADPSVIGRTIRIEGVPVTIVGVGPAGHRGTIDIGIVTDFWLPISSLPALGAPPRTLDAAPTSAPFFVKARLRDGVTVAQAQAAMDDPRPPAGRRVPEGGFPGKGIAVFASSDVRIHPQMDGLHGGRVAAARRRRARAGDRVQQPGDAAARARDRPREGSVGAAGPGRDARQLVRHLLTESLLLSLAGGIAGCLLAWWAIRSLRGSICRSSST